MAKRRHRTTHRRRRHAALNPIRRRRRTYHRRRRHTALNPRRHYRRRRRHSMNRRHYARRRNPAIFGRHGGKDLLMMTGGVLVGVAATKYLPTLLPSSIVGSLGSSPYMGVLITGAGAFAAGWLARKFAGEPFADAVLLGGLAQTASQLLNIIAPPSLSSALALSGMGDILSTSGFPVPQNSVRPMLVPVASKGVGAFRGAFGGRR